MTDAELQLVQRITREVLAALRERGLGERGAGHAAGDGGTARAEVHPPIGVCTGDYSQFPELAGKAVGAAPKPQATPEAAAPAPAVAAPAAPEPIALTGIITANQLEAAIKASPSGYALLAADARLTPLAADLARLKPASVRRAGVVTGSGSAAVPAAALPWIWWIDGNCRIVDEVTMQRRERLRPSGANHNPSSLGSVVRDMAGLIKSKRVAGGILFVHNAARAACLANRCQSIRAVVGTCGEAVEQGVQELGANVLIVEYPHHGHRSMSGLLDRIMQQPPKVPAAVERDLADLHRCG